MGTGSCTTCSLQSGTNDKKVTLLYGQRGDLVIRERLPQERLNYRAILSIPITTRALDWKVLELDTGFLSNFEWCCFSRKAVKRWRHLSCESFVSNDGLSHISEFEHFFSLFFCCFSLDVQFIFRRDSPIPVSGPIYCAHVLVLLLIKLLWHYSTRYHYSNIVSGFGW